MQVLFRNPIKIGHPIRVRSCRVPQSRAVDAFGASTGTAAQTSSRRTVSQTRLPSRSPAVVNAACSDRLSATHPIIVGDGTSPRMWMMKMLTASVVARMRPPTELITAAFKGRYSAEEKRPRGDRWNHEWPLYEEGDDHDRDTEQHARGRDQVVGTFHPLEHGRRLSARQRRQQCRRRRCTIPRAKFAASSV